jgi:hypothetical protein
VGKTEEEVLGMADDAAGSIEKGIQKIATMGGVRRPADKDSADKDSLILGRLFGMPADKYA